LTIRPRAYLCTKWNTHSRSAGLAGDHRTAFSIVLAGNQIADYVLATTLTESGGSAAHILLFCPACADPAR